MLLIKTFKKKEQSCLSCKGQCTLQTLLTLFPSPSLQSVRYLFRLNPPPLWKVTPPSVKYLNCDMSHWALMVKPKLLLGIYYSLRYIKNMSMKCFAQNTKKITHYSLIPFYFISGINMISIMHFTKKVCIMIFMNCINWTLKFD